MCRASVARVSFSRIATFGSSSTKTKSFLWKRPGSSLHPVSRFCSPLFVTTLIPVLTDYPLAFAFMGDMLAGGFFLALAGFFAALAAVTPGIPMAPWERAERAWWAS